MATKYKKLYVRAGREAERAAVADLVRVARASDAPVKLIPTGYSTRRRRVAAPSQTQD